VASAKIRRARPTEPSPPGGRGPYRRRPSAGHDLCPGLSILLLSPPSLSLSLSTSSSPILLFEQVNGALINGHRSQTASSHTLLLPPSPSSVVRRITLDLDLKPVDSHHPTTALRPQAPIKLFDTTIKSLPPNPQPFKPTRTLLFVERRAVDGIFTLSRQPHHLATSLWYRVLISTRYVSIARAIPSSTPYPLPSHSPKMTGRIVDQPETHCGVVTIKREQNMVRLEGQGRSKEKSRRWHTHIPTQGERPYSYWSTYPSCLPCSFMMSNEACLEKAEQRARTAI
jgi:hypothetical protein